MITFKVVRWKNFLSTGNIFTEVFLNANANALIVGENGAGKSTILDAITFSLFGKPFRKINKPGLVNSVNEKNCVTEIEFETNGKNYKIVRGIKPNIFEIYSDGIMINQDSATRDYQEYLDSHILRMNYKSFCQIVILGSASFTPFMQLSASDRRAVIEDLLDIQIFSTMNVIARQRLQQNKEQMERNRIELAAKEDKKNYIEKTLSNLRKNNDERLAEYESQLAEHNAKKKQLILDVTKIGEERDGLIDMIADHDEIKRIHTDMLKLIAQSDNELKRTEKEKNFLSTSDNCPTCKQAIDENFKKGRINDLNSEIMTVCKHQVSREADLASFAEQLANYENISKRIQTITNEISSAKSMMKHLVSVINDTEDAIEKIKSADKLVSDSEKELAETDLEIQTLQAGRETLLADRQYIEVAINLLKDGGIKTKIIKQYLPIINKLINKYLSQMGFFVNFNINESFEETIKSRYRDEFSYQNFSEGEKMRIDLALLFTWRTIAKMRNSVNTNLLILDEIFDGSLDANGTDEFLKIMWGMIADTNTFVISHKTDQLIDKFQKVYRFQKIKNFSQLAA
jgi:DNA repair exonuclease SbcCD ATPase subunit